MLIILVVTRKLFLVEKETCIQAPSLCHTSQPFVPQAPEFLKSLELNLEDDIAVEESTKDPSSILGVPRYRRKILQRPHWGACALTHLEGKLIQVIFLSSDHLDDGN